MLGLTNKLLAKKVQKICVAYPSMEKFFPAEQNRIYRKSCQKRYSRFNREEGSCFKAFWF